MCGVSAEKIIHVEGGISLTGQFDSSCYIKDAAESNLVNSFLSFLQSEPRLGQ